ncbi:MAG: helix-turn-helix domain-containing protein [Lachnospiraceae bacterium]|nr:helix-turn-helix domain-containing protein [Lachnospiraceae bacterium]
MYKIMIADDEGITVDALKFIINKNFSGECIIESAKTGREVILLAETFRPDIAFMDIHMPGINGIDAIKEIKKTQPGIQFIIISAYDKFSYAKTAIELGVSKYINKPFEQSQIIEALSDAIKQIENLRRKRDEDLLIREKLETVVPIIQNGFIHDILFKEHFDEDINNFKRLLGIEYDYGFMLACVFGESQEGNHMTNASGATVYLQNNYKEIKSYIENSFPDSIVSDCMANKIPVFIPYRDSVLDYSIRSDIVNTALNLVYTINQKFEICIRIGFGCVYSIDNMAESYKEALNSLVQSTRSVAHAEDVAVNVEYESNYPIELERELFKNVKQGNVDESILYASKFYEWLLNESDGEESDIRIKVIEFILWAEHLAYEASGRRYVFKSRTGYFDSMNNFALHSELKEWFIDRVRIAAGNVANTKKDKSNSIINKALRYIDNNYTSDISLDGISKEVNVTSYYFSRLFKEEIGVNFVEYVTNLRIERAKELLKQDGHSVKEICMDVGYSDPNYFSRMFKKHVGVTPSEYKEGLF